MLTRKDYRTLASLIADAIMRGELKVDDRFIIDLVSWLKSDNPRFYNETFWKAVDDMMEEHKSQ